MVGRARPQTRRSECPGCGDGRGGSHGSYIEPSRQKLSACLTETWLPAIRSTIRTTSQTAYEQTIRTHLVPSLGNIELRHLRASHLNQVYSDLLERGLSAATVRRSHAVLHRAWPPPCAGS